MVLVSVVADGSVSRLSRANRSEVAIGETQVPHANFPPTF